MILVVALKVFTRPINEQDQFFPLFELITIIQNRLEVTQKLELQMN
jgi:hypothetical protein